MSEPSLGVLRKFNLELQQDKASLQAEVERLKSGGPGGTSDGMDPWQSSVETRLGELSSRVLWLAGGIAISFVTLLTILLTRTDGIIDRLSNVENATSVISTKIDQFDKRSERIERILDERLPRQK